MIVNSVKGRLHLEDPQLELGEGLVIKVSKETEGIILAAEYVQENMKFDEDKNISVDELHELYEKINKACSFIVTDKMEYDKLITIMNKLTLEDRINVMNYIISTAKFEDIEEAEKAQKESAEKAENFR